MQINGKTPEPAARTQGSSWPLCVHLWGKTIDCCGVGTLSCRKLNKCLSSVCCLQEWCVTLRLLNRNNTNLAVKWGKGSVGVQSYIGFLFCVLHRTSCTGVVVPSLRSWVLWHHYHRNLNSVSGNKLAIGCQFCKEIISAPRSVELLQCGRGLGLQWGKHLDTGAQSCFQLFTSITLCVWARRAAFGLWFLELIADS